MRSRFCRDNELRRVQVALASAERYGTLRETGRVRERSLFVAARAPSELELQARWFAGDFGSRFQTIDGKQVEIVQFGTWNREAGPDFLDVAIRVDGDKVVRGSVEIDLVDRSWETHGHAINPAFENAILHVFVESGDQVFFTRTNLHHNVLQVRVDPTKLPDVFSTNVPLARPGRCQAPLHGLPGERVLGVITAASRFRLQRKAARLRTLVENHGEDEALFQEIAAALGYKGNKLPFTLLAQRLPLRVLCANPNEAEALLFGVAGFLAAPDLSVFAAGTRAYVRGLWDQWWPNRDGLQRLVLPAALWRLSGSRPLNHPQRRLAALALIAQEWSKLRGAINGSDPVEATVNFLLELRHPYWNHHYTLTSDPAPKEMALVGESRSAEILANVAFPFLLARGRDCFDEYERLPAQLTNRRLETAVTRLFGDDPRHRSFVKSVAQQQGLLQIYEDFCLRDNSDCLHCPFPEQMQKWA